MACIKGKSICETCGKEFEWRKHDSQPPARFCNRKCTNKDFGIKGNSKRLFWPNATEDEKKERIKFLYEEKVIRKEGCWDWKGHFDKNGYSQVHGYNGKRYVPLKAHRVSYEIHKGEIPKGKVVCHSCDNPRCTNPDHLWIGTSKENSEDEVKKGRSSKGEDRYNARFREEDIREIRKRLNDGVTQTRIAKDYGVHLMTINFIAQGKTWKHVI